MTRGSSTVLEATETPLPFPSPSERVRVIVIFRQDSFLIITGSRIYRISPIIGNLMSRDGPTFHMSRTVLSLYQSF